MSRRRKKEKVYVPELYSVNGIGGVGEIEKGGKKSDVR